MAPDSGPATPGSIGAERAASLEEPTGPVRITGWASGGEGVGRFADGRVVFVDGAIPGDVVEVADLQMRKKLARGKVGRLVEASDGRVEPECRHFGECGGCAWQHVRYSAQLGAKQEIVRNALTRIGRVDYTAEIQIEGSPSDYGYRARARVVEVDAGASVDRGVGYRHRGGHDVIPISECPILLPSAQLALTELNAGRSADSNAARQQEAPAGIDSAESNRRRPTEWILTAGSSGSALVERKGPSRGRGRGQVAGKPGSVVLDVLGERLRARSASFVQGNALLWEAFATAVRSEALRAPVPERFVELYAGMGFFTLPLARAGLSGVAVESEASATSDLRFNLAENGLANRVEVKAARVEKRGDLAVQFSRADLLVVDPPRTGLEKKVRDVVAGFGPKRMIYVSCDPGTWARDVSAFVESGYRVEHVQAFDLFPQTPHVEIVSRLERVERVEKPMSGSRVGT